MSVATVEAIVNGQTYALKLDLESNSYKAVATAPLKSSFPLDGHYYPIVLRAIDEAGNAITIDSNDPVFGDRLRLDVDEKNPPIINPVYPTASSTLTNSAIEFVWIITDNDSGVDPDSISITIDDDLIENIAIQKESIDGGYKCVYSLESLPDGAHVYRLNASDFDGNSALEVSTSFKIDTAPPTLVIVNPKDGLITNQRKLTIDGTTNDLVSGPVSLTINDVNVEVGPDGSFSYEFELSPGVNVITIVSTDKIGKVSSVVRNVELDTVPPVFQEVTITPNPVDAGNTFVISVRVSD